MTPCFSDNCDGTCDTCTRHDRDEREWFAILDRELHLENFRRAFPNAIDAEATDGYAYRWLDRVQADVRRGWDDVPF